VYVGLTEEEAAMRQTPPGHPNARETRLSVRIKPAQKALIARAAGLRREPPAA
jgi:hypothetical protein